MHENNIARGDLFFLWHPGSVFTFSGYGLAVEAGRKDLLVGILMVDRPRPVLEIWLTTIEQTFGSHMLHAMTLSHERGIACQMHVEAESLPYIRSLNVPVAQPMAEALTPLLAQPPKPHFVVQWDPVQKLWTSKFARNVGTERPQEGTTRRAQPASLPLFPLGQVVATPGALAALAEAGQSPEEFLARHVTADWGELPPEDIAENERALKYGNRLFSSYRLAGGAKMYVITEWDRSVTTLLLAHEY